MLSPLPLGEPPADDVEAAARLLVRYRKAGMLDDGETGAIFARMVNDPAAVAARALEIEAHPELHPI